MSLIDVLASMTGTYFGTGDGPESGPFLARIVLGSLPNGGVSIDYEATSREQGVQHREHTLLVAGPDGRERLYVAHSQSPFLTEMVAAGAEAGRFAQPEPFGPYEMEIVITCPEPGRLTYAWWWAESGGTPIERSKATVEKS